MIPGEPTLLLKLHGLGNDFLVLVDSDRSRPVDAAMARRLCDRHAGVGADGLIRVTPGAGDGSDFAMELLNADGSRAETSGNGLRCLALALQLSGKTDGSELTVATDAGPRLARIGPIGSDWSAEVSVEMGEAHLGEEVVVLGRRARLVDMGNPHLVVLVEDPGAVALEVDGPAEEARHPGGINVSFAAVRPGGSVRLRTWERGAGATLACGSGSCATAAVLRDWGMVGDVVEVASPGGPVTVSLGAAGGGVPVVLTGPAQLICRVELPGEAGTTGNRRAQPVATGAGGRRA